jgi:hypothetical protein
VDKRGDIGTSSICTIIFIIRAVMTTQSTLLVCLTLATIAGACTSELGLTKDTVNYPNQRFNAFLIFFNVLKILKFQFGFDGTSTYLLKLYQTQIVVQSDLYTGTPNGLYSYDPNAYYGYSSDGSPVYAAQIGGGQTGLGSVYGVGGQPYAAGYGGLVGQQCPRITVQLWLLGIYDVFLQNRKWSLNLYKQFSA